MAKEKITVEKIEEDVKEVVEDVKTVVDDVKYAADQLLVLPEFKGINKFFVGAILGHDYHSVEEAKVKVKNYFNL